MLPVGIPKRDRRYFSHLVHEILQNSIRVSSTEKGNHAFEGVFEVSHINGNINQNIKSVIN